DRLAGLREHLGFTMRPRDPRPQPATDTLLTLGAAARDRRRVTLDYRSWRGERTRRRFDPYGLVFHAGRWYVTGHDHLRGQPRTFRLDRVDEVTTGAETFTAPAGLDPVAQVTRGLAAVPYAVEVRVLLAVDLPTASRRIPATVAGLTETDDGVLLHTRAESLDGMAHLLAGLGWPFTVLTPDELRTAVARHAARLA
ncbi:WYL domain-containing protein, partial [Micromonospora zhanjiangensis]